MTDALTRRQFFTALAAGAVAANVPLPTGLGEVLEVPGGYAVSPPGTFTVLELYEYLRHRFEPSRPPEVVTAEEVWRWKQGSSRLYR